MVRLVLFDIDGTLIRTGGAGEKAFAKVCASVFHVPDGVKDLKFAGRTDPSIVREFFARHHIPPDPENFNEFFGAYVFWLDHLLGQSQGKVLPGVHQLMHDLQSLPQPPRIGLLTGNVRLGAQIKLTHFNLWDYFETGAFGDDHEDRNQLACIARDRGSRLLNQPLRGHQILIVGDTPLDIACARAINAKIIAVATGGHPLHELIDHAPTWAIEDLRHTIVHEVCA